MAYVEVARPANNIQPTAVPDQSGRYDFYGQQHANKAAADAAAARQAEVRKLDELGARTGVKLSDGSTYYTPSDRAAVQHEGGTFWDDVWQTAGEAAGAVGGAALGSLVPFGPTSIGIGALAGNAAAGGDGMGVLSDIDEFLFGSQGDPNAGTNAALGYMDWVNGGLPPNSTSGIYGSMSAPVFSPITAQTYAPATVTYGAQAPVAATVDYGSYAPRQSLLNLDQQLGRGSYTPAPAPNTINVPRLTTTDFNAPDPLGYGTPLSLQNVQGVRSISAPTIGPAPDMRVARVSNPGAVGVERISNMGPVDVRTATPMTNIGVDRLGQAGDRALREVSLRTIGDQQATYADFIDPAAVERVGYLATPDAQTVDFGSQYRMLDPSTLGLDTAWAEGFEYDPRIMESQFNSLDQMRQVIEGNGWDPVTEAAYQRQVAEAEARRRGNALAIQREAELQGMGGSGTDILAQLQAGQASVQDQYLGALEAAALGAQRQDVASQNQAAVAANLRSQLFNEQASRAAALDAWEQAMLQAQMRSSEVNTGRALQTDLTNTAAENQFLLTGYQTNSQRELQNAAAQNASNLAYYQGQTQTELFNTQAANRALENTYMTHANVQLQNAAAANAAYAQEYEMQGRYDLADAAAQNAAYLQQAANIQQAEIFNAGAYNNAYNLEYNTNANFAMQNAAAQNAAYQTQYRGTLDVNLANAQAQNNAYGQQYALQGQYNITNANNTLSADQFNVGNQLVVNRDNARYANDAALSNWQRQGNVDMFNAGNQYNSALSTWQNQQEANRINTSNQLNAALASMNATNTAGQFNAGQRQDASIYNSGLTQQQFQNQMALAQGKQSEQQFYAGLLSGQVQPNTPGLADKLLPYAQIVGAGAMAFG